MNIHRLNKLAEVLENFKAERKNLVPLPGNGYVQGFDLGSWGSEGVKNGEKNVCSTTACAAGTAALHPWFREKGLMMVKDYSVTFKTLTEFAAYTNFFDIEYDDALFLFDPKSYPKDRRGEKSVARRIRYLVAGGTNRTRYAGLKLA